MSIENIDSLDTCSEGQSNRFTDKQTLPPMISNSPPPHLDACEDAEIDEKFNSDSITEFNKNRNFLAESNSSEEICNISLPYLKSESLLNHSPVSNKKDLIENNTESAVKLATKSNVLEAFDDEENTFPANDFAKLENKIKSFGEEVNKLETDFDPFNSQSNEETSGWADFGQSVPTFETPNNFDIPEPESMKKKLEKN